MVGSMRLAIHVWRGQDPAYFGTTGSESDLRAFRASFHLAAHRHHLQPAVRPAARRLFPRDDVKSRNSSVTTAGVSRQRLGLTGWAPLR